MNPAILLLLLFDGDGEAASGSHGFLCVHSVTIKPGLVCSASIKPGMEGDATINPGLTGQPEVNQCQ